MTINEWRGDAQPTAQVDLLIPGVLEPGDTLKITINRKIYSYTVPVSFTKDPDTGYVSAVVAAMVDELENTFKVLYEEFNEVTWTSGTTVFSSGTKITHIVATGPTDGKPITITTTTGNANAFSVIVTEAVKGVAGKNEIQKVSIPAPTTGGTFTLAFQGQVTSALPWNETAANVDTALEALSTIGAGQVTVLKVGLYWTVEFTGTLAQTDVPLLVGNGSALIGTGSMGIAIATVTEGSAAIDEIQKVGLPATTTGGTFTLTFDGQTTAAIAYNASKYTVRDALCDLSNIAGTNEVQTLTSTATGGTFTISLEGVTTAAIAFNASAATIVAAIELVLSSGDVTATGGPLNTTPVVITFKQAYGRSNRAQMTVDNTSATGGTVVPSTTTAGVASDVTVLGAGPWTVDFGGAYAGVNVPLMTGSGASLTGAGVVTVATTTDGGPGTNEIGTMSFEYGPTYSFTITFVNPSGVSSTSPTITFAPIPAFTTTAAIVSALQFVLDNMSSIGSGNTVVSVQSTVGTTWVFKVIFSGALAAQNVNVLTCTAVGTGSAPTYAVTTEGSTTDVNEVQVVSLNSPTGGTFTLTFSGQTTAATAYDATATTVRTNLLALSNLADGTTEVQTITITGTPTGGTFTLTFGGQTTSAIAYNASAATVVAELEALSTIGTGGVTGGGGALPGSAVLITFALTLALRDQPMMTSTSSLTGGTSPTITITASTPGVDGGVDVTGSAGGPWTVTFMGTTGGTDVSQMTGSGASLTGGSVGIATIQTAVAGINEVETVTLTGTPTGGTFKLVFNGETTGTIAYNATSVTVLAALVALATPVSGDFTVTGSDGGPWTVTFLQTYGYTNVTQMSSTSNALTGGTVTVSTTQDFAVAVNEQQSVQLGSGVTGGTFTLTFNGETTSALPYNETAANIQTALIALSTPVAGDITVSGATGGPWTATFLQAYAASDVSLMVGDGTLLTGPGTQTFTVTHYVTPTGPAWFTDPDNWSLGTLLATGEIGIFRNTDRPCRYGLNSATTVAITPLELHFYSSFTGDIGLKDDNGDYIEYRDKELTLGTNGAGTLKVFVGEDAGSGMSLFRLNTGGKQTEFHGINTSQNAGGSFPCANWRGTHASNAVYLNKGSYGIGFNSEAVTMSTFTQGFLASEDQDVTCWIGETATLATVVMNGGELHCKSAITTSLTMNGGIAEVYGTGAVAQLTINDENCFCYYNTTGNLGGTTYVAPNSVLTFEQDDRAKTVSNPIQCYWADGVRDPNKVVATLIVDYVRSTPNDNLGSHVRITRVTAA